MLCCHLQRARERLSREELELLDVEKQMEEQLVTEHMQVRRAAWGPLCASTANLLQGAVQGP